MRTLGLMFSRKWFLTTVLVLLGSALCLRLGIWQLDRLAQRRAFNAHVTEMWSLPPLRLDALHTSGLAEMEFRAVQLSGSYDFADQVALRNQYHGGELGYHLLTPLILEPGLAVLVDRGWIPADGNSSAKSWRAYDEPTDASIKGILRRGRATAEIGGLSDPDLAPGQSRLEVWSMVNLQRIGAQLPYKLLDAYVQPDPDPADSKPPIPYQPQIELSEGPHFGYAGQWFVFAAMLFFGYPFFYLRKQV